MVLGPLCSMAGTALPRPPRHRAHRLCSQEPVHGQLSLLHWGASIKMGTRRRHTGKGAAMACFIPGILQRQGGISSDNSSSCKARAETSFLAVAAASIARAPTQLADGLTSRPTPCSCYVEAPIPFAASLFHVSELLAPHIASFLSSDAPIVGQPSRREPVPLGASVTCSV